jgi:transducin (beta)-like 1
MYNSQCNLSRSKDAVVNIWNLPNPPSEPSHFAEQPGPPLVIDYFAKPEQGDLTSLHWNADGSLLAVGSYDAVLRVCSPSGALYFSNPQHSVNKPFFSMPRTSDCSCFLPLRRALFSPRDFPSLVVGCLLQVSMVQPASGMSRENGYISNIVVIQVIMNPRSLAYKRAQISLPDCCLDIDWLNDTTFATCGADQVIHVMRIDADDPIKTFTYGLYSIIWKY